LGTVFSALPIFAWLLLYATIFLVIANGNRQMEVSGVTPLSVLLRRSVHEDGIKPPGKFGKNFSDGIFGGFTVVPHLLANTNSLLYPPCKGLAYLEEESLRRP
jgi:hypothetical protein